MYKCNAWGSVIRKEGRKKKNNDKKVVEQKRYEVFDASQGDKPVTVKLGHQLICHYCKKPQTISTIYQHMKCCSSGDFLTIKKTNKISKERKRLRDSK